MKRHPYLLGFAIFALAAMAFYAVVVGSFALLGKSHTPRLILGNGSVGVVDVLGVIERSHAITEQIRDYVDDDSIGGLLVRIDSPGGAVAPTQEIYSELRKAAKAGKPVVATLGSTAASGGYYVAAGCEQIVANPGTLTGSIGVIMEFINLEGTFEKLGLKSDVVKSGKYKDAGNYARSLTPEERRMLQTTIDDVHGQFVAAVAEGRGLPSERVEAIADGRVFSGQQAQALGLVDQLGTFYDAVDLLKEKMGVKGKVDLVFPKKKHRTDILDFFIEETSDRLQRSLAGALGGEGEQRLYFR